MREERKVRIPKKLHLDYKFTIFKPKLQRPKFTGEVRQKYNMRDLTDTDSTFNYLKTKQKKVEELARASTAGMGGAAPAPTPPCAPPTPQPAGGRRARVKHSIKG